MSNGVQRRKVTLTNQSRLRDSTERQEPSVISVVQGVWGSSPREWRFNILKLHPPVEELLISP